jgi:error-prone DNA polymerase
VAAFASFGFNKSHAAAFARTAYESAFLKLFYPAQFVTGLINAQPMGFYPVEVLVNDAKRHGVASCRSTSTAAATAPDRVGRAARHAAARGRRHRSAAGVGPLVRLRRAHRVRPATAGRRPARAATASASGCTWSRASARRRASRSTPSGGAAGRSRSLADLVARTELAEEIVERLIRAGALDSLGRAAAPPAVAAARGGAAHPRQPVGRAGARPAPAADRSADLAAPTELERLGDAYAILSLDARRQVVELFRPALDRLGVVPAGKLVDARPGRVKIGGLVVTRQHPMTARGTVFLALEDETGMVNVTLWPDTWARFRGPSGAMRCSTSRVGWSASRTWSTSSPVTCGHWSRSGGRSVGQQCRQGVRQMGHAGMRRLG